MKNGGSGIPRILHECSEYGLPEPDFTDFDGDFRVNMFQQRSEKEGSHTDDTKTDTNDIC
ncbi:ATP-binding protein [Holdemania filiformis]|uniref:ATP-binding protein n=1 Tax=Holdemania filiformis TaxID=61171 RepID=UPI00349F0523